MAKVIASRLQIKDACNPTLALSKNGLIKLCLASRNPIGPWCRPVCWRALAEMRPAAGSYRASTTRWRITRFRKHLAGPALLTPDGESHS